MVNSGVGFVTFPSLDSKHVSVIFWPTRGLKTTSVFEFRLLSYPCSFDVTPTPSISASKYTFLGAPEPLNIS